MPLQLPWGGSWWKLRPRRIRLDRSREPDHQAAQERSAGGPDLQRLGRHRHGDAGARSRAATGCAWRSCRLATTPPISSSSTARTGRRRGSRRCWRTRPCSSSSTSPASTWACSPSIWASRPGPVYCTKIASKLARTYTDRHGLKDLCAELLGVDLSKQQQSSDWAADKLTDQQKHYAASDVLYLHALKAKLDAMLQREGRMAAAEACFRFLPVRVTLDLAGFEDDGHLRALTRERLRDLCWCQLSLAHPGTPLSRCREQPFATNPRSRYRPHPPQSSARSHASLRSRRASAASRRIPRMPRRARPSACSAAPSIRRMPRTA